MNEKEFFVKISENYLTRANEHLANARRVYIQNYQKLQADYELTVYNLESTVKEAKIKRENMDAKATKADTLLADVAIEKAEKALKFGIVKAKADFEVGYLALKLEVQNKTNLVEQEKICLEFAEAEKDRGFSI